MAVIILSDWQLTCQIKKTSHVTFSNLFHVRLILLSVEVGFILFKNLDKDAAIY